MARPRRNPEEADFDMSHLPEDIRSDMESRMREREEIMRARFDRDREGILRGKNRFDPSSFEGSDHDEIMRHHMHHHSMDELHRVHKDISERHKELIDHRQKVSNQ